MHVSLFGIIKILEEMKALSSSFAKKQQQMVACGTTLWHVGQLCDGISFLGE
jgi:hypothetical protein